MMNTKVKLLLAIIWCHLLPALSAQEMINVRHYSIEDGLSQNIVQDMLQDNDGYIWLATWNGLEKFDGYTFKNYKSYPTDDTKLKYNRLVSIVKGADDALWCHTYDDKVYLFDVRQEKFNDIFVYHPQIEECKLVEKMIPLTNGIIWIIASDGNLWRIDEAMYKKDKGVMFLPSGSVPQHGNRVYSVVRDAHDNEWVLTDKGCFVYGKRELSDSRNFNNAICIDHILYMSSPDGELVTCTPEEGIKEISIKETDYGIIDLLELPNAKMGIMTNRGIIIYDTQNNHAESILVNENHPDIQPSYHLLSNNGILWMINGNENVIRCDLKQKSISFINYPLSQKEKANIFIHEDNYGRIWILAPNGEFSFYNPITNVFEQGYTYINGEHTYYHATGRKFLIDNQQNIWLSCDSGVDQLTFLNESYSYFSTGHNDKIRGLFVDSKQRIWVADKSERIEIYNDNHEYCGNLSRDGHLVKDKQLVFGADIYCFFEDEQHRIWMGSRTGGIYVAVPEAGKFRIYHFKYNEKDKNSLSSDAIFSICQDTKGNIWVGTYGGGLNVVEGSFPNLKFAHYQNGLELYPKNKYLRVRSLLCTSAGIMLVGTTDGLLTFSTNADQWEKIQFNLNQCETKRANSLSNNDVVYVFESRKGDIYVVTHSSGLNLVSSKDLLCDNIEFIHLNKLNGLPSDMAYTISEGKDNELWINFENHICKYNPVENTIDTYDRFYFHSHLAVSEIPFIRDKNNGMYVALNREVLYLDLDKLKKSQFAPHIVFTDVRTRKNYKQERSSPVTNRELTLEKDERNVSITFAALDFAGSGHLQYAYRLKNIDEEWNYIGNSRTASLVNLPAGDFILEVKSTNGDGLWVENTAQLAIHVKPIFWETGWAWLLYIALIVVVILAISATFAYIFNLRRKVDFEQQLTNLKLRFFTDISHELRTPLTLIASPIEEIINREKLSDEGQENIQLAKKNTDRMLRLINQLLDFRKIQNNKMKLYIEQADVVTLSKKIYDNFTGLAHQRNIDFHFVCPYNNYTLYTDIDKLEKILFNLLSNAFKYTPDGKNIDLILEFKEKNLLIKVKDEGNGIELHKIDMLFKRFETLGQTDANLSSGIGLSLVKEWVDMLHGTITVDSKLGYGSTFSISLPGEHEIFESDKNVEFILNDSESSMPMDSGITQNNEEAEGISVLVVEDNEELRHFMVNILRKDYHVIEAENGKTGLEKIKSKIPDLVISDIMMPCLDGIELLEEVKKDYNVSHIPFVLLSAKATLDDRIKGLEYGADDYITKPFSSGYLRARISSLLKQRSILREHFMKEVLPVAGKEPVVNQDDILENLSPSVPQITSYDEDFIHKIIQAVEERLQDSDFKIEDLADSMNIGRSVFYKKVKSILGVSPIELVKDMRIKRAIQLLETGNYNISQIAYMSGFSSSQYFSRVFKELKNCTPSEYKIKN